MMTRFFHGVGLARLIAIVGFALLAIAATSTPSWAEAGSENFVRANVQRGLTILNNHSISEAQKRAQFRDFLTSLTDIRRIAMFTLGLARRTATPQEQDQFATAFRDYAVAVYESRLSAYAGQSLRVTGSTEHAPGDDIVTTILVDPSGKANNQGEPIEVDFRVENETGRYVVIDASIAGVWLALEERDQFTAFLQENHDSVPALISHLNALTQRLHSGGPNTPTH
ncbi:MAG: ABC transporter substrate-binding protein [Rhizomicrobium sp.]|jgi:phospholipid transport system substrate-binding protein